MNQKIIIQRLAFAKYLIERGNLESKNSEPFSSIALLHYHDALELIFNLIIEDKSVNIKKPYDLSFMKKFNEINKIQKKENKKIINFERSLNTLKDLRVNLKHKGIYPTKLNIRTLL